MDEYFVCRPLRCVLSLDQCKDIRKRPQENRFPYCKDCTLYKTAVRYNKQQMLDGLPREELLSLGYEKTISRIPTDSLIDRYLNANKI